MPANFQTKAGLVARMPVSRANPITVPDTINQSLNRDHDLTRMAVANQYAKSRAEQSNKDYLGRMGVANENSKSLSALRYRQDIDKEKLKHILGEQSRSTTFGRAREAAAKNKIFGYQATTGAYDAGPLGMTSTEQMAWQGATKTGTLAKKQRTGRDMYTYNLMRENAAYDPAEFSRYLTQGLTDHRATRPAMEQWMKRPSKLVAEALPQIRANGSRTGSPLPPKQLMPDEGTAGYRELQRLYLTETGQMSPIAEEVKSRLSAREYKQVQDRDMISALLKGQAAPWEHFGSANQQSGPLGYSVGRPSTSASIKGATGGLNFDNLDEHTASNPIGHALVLGGGAYGGVMASKPYREASKFAASDLGKSIQAVRGGAMQNALSTAIKDLDNIKLHPREMTMGGANSPLTRLSAEVSELATAQRAVLKANGVEIAANATPQQILKQFEETAARQGHRLQIPKQQQKVFAKLGKGALGGIWKRAAAAVIGPTAAGSSAGPWGSAVGFTVGLGMAAWAAYDMYSLAKDLINDE
jgi:hypothetical protein